MYANETRDEPVVHFQLWLKWHATLIIFWLLGNDVIFPESRPLIFLYLYTRIRSTQKQIAEYDIKSKYTEEYSTVDKVGRENIMALRLSEYLTQLPELTMRTEVSLLHCF